MSMILFDEIIQTFEGTMCYILIKSLFSQYIERASSLLQEKFADEAGY